jgi:ABC-type Mn2+/Zn2+ transport system ATPase subunit
MERPILVDRVASMSVIEIQNLSKTFAGRTVLNNISFSVKRGEVFGYLGPNGAGKTTTMRVLLGLLKPTGGTALVQGFDLAVNDKARADVGVLMDCILHCHVSSPLPKEGTSACPAKRLVFTFQLGSEMAF